ncbi:MAG: ribonuclease HII [Wolinella sp.]
MKKRAISLKIHGLFEENIHKLPIFDICGIDEAGRGCLAGSLFVAGAVLQREIVGVKDSKKLKRAERYKLYEEITNNSTFHIVQWSAQEVDSCGLSHCLRESLRQIYETLNARIYLFDGNTTFGAAGITPAIKGDALFASISAASILAKVSKDREMEALDTLYPVYGFAQNCGYGTHTHREAILRHGYSDVHRKSFVLKKKGGVGVEAI